MTRWILTQRHAVWALVIAIAVFGYMSYKMLPIQLFPDTAPPLVNIITAYPGATADSVAQEVSQLIEEELASLEGVVKIKSSSQNSLSVVSIEFNYNISVDAAAIDVQNAISRIRKDLPRIIQEPQVLKFSTTDRPVVTYAVRADNLVHARSLVENVLAPRLQQVLGVAAVDVFGGSRPTVLVEVDRQAVEAARIPLPRIVENLRTYNSTSPAGRIRGTTTQSMFRVDTRAQSMQDLLDIPVSTLTASRVLLGDLATARLGARDDDSRFRLNGKPSIAMQILKSSDANTVEVVERTRRVVAELRANHPGIEILEGEESASFAQKSVDNLIGNIWQAIGFTAIIMLFFLRRWQTSVVVAMTMPLAFGITFAVMKIIGIDLNMVTLSAIILSVGIVIDNSVVVLENIVRHQGLGNISSVDAAAVGTDEIIGATFGGTLTNLAVLLPLLFLTGFTSKTFGPLAQTLFIAFSSSLVVAIVLIPLFSTFIHAQRGGSVDRIVHLISMPFDIGMSWLKERSLDALRFGLRHRLLIIIMGVILLAIGIVGLRSRGMDVLPKMDNGSFYVSLETPSGSSLEETERVVAQVEDIIRQENEVRLIQSQVGFEPGMRQTSSFGAQGPTQGYISVTLTDRNKRKLSVWDIQGKIREQIKKIPGIRVVTVRELGNTARATTSAPVVVRISGVDPLVLNKLGDEVMARLAKVSSVVAPMRNWRLDQRQGLMEIHTLKAAQQGITPAVIAQTLLAGTDGIEAGSFYGDAGVTRPILVSFEKGQRNSVDDILRFPVFPPSSRDFVPVSEFVEHREVLEQGLVTREQLSRSLEVSAFIEGRPLSFVTVDVEAALSDLVVPHEYAVVLAGEKGDLAESKGEIGLALLVGIVGVYLLLVAQFRSFVHPLTVLMSIPLSLSGIAAALFLTGKPISMPVMVGLILIVGTVINSAILLISFIEQQREKGMAVHEAILASVDLRFRPIMMTSVSTIVGMLPLAAEWSLGAERFSPLAIAVMGGFSTATVFTVIVIPVLYSVFSGKKGIA